MVEKLLEAKIVDAIKDLEIEGASVVGSRQAAAAGMVKGDENIGDVEIAVALGLRQHDDFTLPTGSISGAVTVMTSVEHSPTGSSHEEVLGKIVDMFANWHYHSVQTTAALTVTGFYVAALRLDGGAGKSYDSARSAWVESFNFTIRGTIQN